MKDFNLKEALADWKRSLRREQGLEPGMIEELESHLYDRIDEYIEDGCAEELAFKLAVGKVMPESREVANEFYKTNQTTNKRPPWQRQSYFWNKMPLHIKVALRSIKKRKAYSILNIGGLAVSICTAALIWFYVKDQSSYDRHYEDSDRIYRVINDITFKNRKLREARASMAVGPTLMADFPEVVQVGRIRRIGSFNTLTTPRIKIDSEDVFAADSAFLSLFNIPFSSGRISDALDDPSSIVLSESMAELLFGQTDVVGQTLTYSGVSAPREMKVTGVFPDLDRHTHLPFKALVPMSNFFPKEAFTTWWLEGVYTYIKLNAANDIRTLEAKLPDFVNRHFNPHLERAGATGNFLFQAITNIHLDEEYLEEPYPHSSREDLQILSAVMIFLLIMSCINYINMATARSVDRALEVGIKKTLGSGRGSLFMQFLTEAVMLALLAGMLAILLSVIIYKPYLMVTGLEFSLGELMSWQHLVGCLIVSVLVGLLSGIYPSIYLSAFRPAAVLKGKFSSGKKGLTLRKTLIVVQYAVSLILISGVIIVASQIHYIKTKDIGYVKESLLQIPIPDDTLVNQNTFLFLDQVREMPRVRNAAFSYSDLHSSRNTNLMGILDVNGEPTRARFRSPYVGDGFVKAIGARIVAGRGFDPQMNNDSTFMLNEAAMEKYGWDSFSDLKWKGWNGNQNWRCIGVVGDFNLGESHKEKVPMMLIHNAVPHIDAKIFVGINENNVAGAINDIQQVWQVQFPGYSFDYEFVEDKLNALYEGEDLFLNQVLFLGTTILFVTVIGIFGLISFTTVLRRKEIAVRKVNGASVNSILGLLARQFLVLIMIATFAAVPLSILLSEQWLNNFQERIGMEIWPHVFALPLCLLLTGVSVGYQAWRAARESPIQALRLE